MARKQKLELSWVGKGTRPNLEPRILIEKNELSYLATHRKEINEFYDNYLIHGDNLLALKAIEQSFSGKVQCVYIDPPFNTGEAFEHYDDGLEHSIWLDLMFQRLKILHKLLKDTGSIFVHIDDNELGYLIVMLDEIFGRKNRINIVTFKQSSASGPKAINPGLVTTANYVLIYAKDKKRWFSRKIFQATPRDARYNNFIVDYELGLSNWRLTTLRDAFSKHHQLTWDEAKARFADRLEDAMTTFVMAFADRVVQPALVRDKDINAEARLKLNLSRECPGLVCTSPRDDFEDYYFLNGKQLLFYKNKVRNVLGEQTTALAASNIWDDLLSNNIHQEGSVRLPKGKKPEALIQRILNFVTSPGDIVLDSFLGSGTTAAVAHKMRRRWIGIELGEQAITHCYPRLKSVVDGDDPTGITRAENWNGGGGFRVFELGPSLIAEDQWGNPVINPAFNPAMLAEAMCKLEGFTYSPSDEFFWIHGHSTETDFIYVTTQFMSREMLVKISDEVGPERSLLVCCTAFKCDTNEFNNITLKKIPKAVLKKCEWGHDDYSLAVENLPEAPHTPVPEAEPQKEIKSRTFGKTAQQASLFDQPQGDE